MPSTEFKLIIFAKAPVPGKTKTRLVPALGEIGAAELHQRMIQHTSKMAFDAGFANIEIRCHPDSTHPVFLEILDRHCVELNRQSGDDLGERMANALEAALCEHPYAIVIGTDAPVVDSGYISNAIEQLQSGHEIVLGPAEDGGYVLIGLSRFNRKIFSKIDWGTNRVLEQTLEKIKAEGMTVFQLPVLWDVDTPKDLDKIKNSPALSYLLQNH